MNANNENKILAAITLLVFILVVIQASYNIIKVNNLSNTEKIVSKTQIIKVSENQISAKVGYADIGRAEICINIPPILTNDCNMTDAILDNTIDYNCTFEAIDPNDDDITFSINWSTRPIMFNITPYGEINFNPKRASMIDVNTFTIIMNDSSGCTNSYSYEEFNVLVLGENRPPYLMTNISNQTLIKNQYLRFYLNDYFSDPDEDELSYFSILQEGNTVKIKIIGNMVEIKGQHCGISKAYFVATDPLGLTAQSNIVEYNITCPENDDGQGYDDQDNSGGGSSNDGSSRICISDWVCSSWAPCLPNNITYKRCLDYNGCENDYEQYLYDNCTYEINTQCNEKWECNDWSRCENGIRTRMCIDLRNCGTNNNKPNESESCSEIQTCYNGIMDGDETGIDCGGSCGACRFTENPAQIDKISPITLITISLTIGLTIIVIFIYRYKIRLQYNKLFGKKSKIKKRIYITDKQKEQLLQSINVIQARIDDNKIDYAIDEMNVFIKEYFKQLLSIDIINKEELLAKIIKLNDKDLEKILIMFYAKITKIIHLRNTGVDSSMTTIQSLTDEMTNRVYMVGEFKDSDALNSIKDRANISSNSADLIFNKLSNLYIALKFEEITIAKNIYKEILKDYDKLLEKEKSEIYNDIIRAYESINYLEKQYGKK